MYKKPMTKIQFMTAAAGRRKKRAAVVLELGKKGSGEVAKLALLRGRGSRRGGIRISTRQPFIFQDKTEPKLIVGLRKVHAGRDNVADPLSFIQREYRIIGSVGLAGNPSVLPSPPPKPKQSQYVVKTYLSTKPEGGAAIQALEGDQTVLPKK